MYITMIQRLHFQSAEISIRYWWPLTYNSKVQILESLVQSVSIVLLLSVHLGLGNRIMIAVANLAPCQCSYVWYNICIGTLLCRCSAHYLSLQHESDLCTLKPTCIGLCANIQHGYRMLLVQSESLFFPLVTMERRMPLQLFTELKSLSIYIHHRQRHGPKRVQEQSHIGF